MITSARSGAAQQPAAAAIRPELLRALEALGECGEQLPSQAGPLLQDLVPALCQVLSDDQGEPAEARFTCAKVLSDVILTLTASAASSGGASSLSVPVDALFQSVSQHLMPLMAPLLEETGMEALPLHSLKVLVALLELDGARWAPEVARLGLVPRFVAFLSLDSPNNNVHNLRVVRALCASGALGLSDIQALGLVGKLEAILAYSHENMVDPFLEPVLELCATVLFCGGPGNAQLRGPVSWPVPRGVPPSLPCCEPRPPFHAAAGAAAGAAADLC